jgi:hypothetical protein
MCTQKMRINSFPNPSLFITLNQLLQILTGATKTSNSGAAGMGGDPSLQGEEGRESRAQVYLFLAECLADEQRFNTMGRISTDLLGAYLDGDSAVSHELLHDALSGQSPITQPLFAQCSL